jgi:hypothetical protein
VHLGSGKIIVNTVQQITVVTIIEMKDNNMYFIIYENNKNTLTQ